MTSRVLLLAGVAAIAAPLHAQERSAPPSSNEQAAAGEDYSGDDGETIVVQGDKPRGSVVGDIPAENILSPRDIRATGATSIAELLDAVSAQTGSARGRSSGPPVVLLNGQRISGFRELRDLPPEAIERMEILPEEVAIKYGYSADQRVVNIVLRRRFDSTTVEARGTLATDGGYAAARAEGGKLIIRDKQRTSLNLVLDGNNPLYESERDIRLDSATLADPRDARTLVGSGKSARLTGVVNRPVGDTSLTITGEASKSDGRSRFGLSPFDGSRLTRDSDTTSLALGSALNATKDGWRLSSTANLTLDKSESESDRSLLTALNDDVARSTRRGASIDGTATGDLFATPGGRAGLTARIGLSRNEISSDSRRADVERSSDLGRTTTEGSLSLDLPLSPRDGKIGRLSANLNAGLKGLSDYGGLASWGGGLNWGPAPRLNLLASFTREQGAPSLQQLGDPLLVTDGVPFFDAVRGETVDVTTRSGGNPDLLADRRTVWKLGTNWQPKEKLDLRLRADFVREVIDNPQVGFPAVTPALEAAFPDRFSRDGSGRLTAVDLRPVNARESRRTTLRVGFDFTKPLKSTPPTAEQMKALRERFLRNLPAGSRPPEPPAGAQSGAASGAGEGQRRFGGGGGRFGGPGGSRNGGRLTFSLTDTISFKDELTIADGLPTLDYLDGEALGSTGGRARHQVEGQGGYYNDGLGARVSANWRSGTRVDSASGGLDFSPYATFDLRLFANLGERLDLVSKNPFFIGSTVRFEVKNLFNARPEVRGTGGSIPIAYDPARLEPIGRTVGVSFRKLFFPARFFTFGGGRGGSGAAPGGGGSPPPPPSHF